jgi:hypothetical protein
VRKALTVAASPVVCAWHGPKRYKTTVALQ